MPSSWTQNYYHAVYSTKHRTPWITPEVEDRLHPFLGGIAKDLECTPIAINGMVEHVHVLLRFPSDLAVSNLARLPGAGEGKLQPHPNLSRDEHRTRI